jgi:hypothetical protein
MDAGEGSKKYSIFPAEISRQQRAAQTRQLVRLRRRAPSVLLLELLQALPHQRDARLRQHQPLPRAALVLAPRGARRRAQSAMACRRMARRARWTLTRCGVRHLAHHMTPSLRWLGAQFWQLRALLQRAAAPPRWVRRWARWARRWAPLRPRRWATLRPRAARWARWARRLAPFCPRRWATLPPRAARLAARRSVVCARARR